MESRIAAEERTIYESVRMVAHIFAEAVVKAISEREQALPRPDGGWIRPSDGDATHGEPGRLALSVGEVAKLLGLGRNAAYQAVHSGQIPSIRFGDRIYVPRAALMRLLDQVANPRKA